MRGAATVDEARRDIVDDTMRYAKRQMTWFRHQADVAGSPTPTRRSRGALPPGWTARPADGRRASGAPIVVVCDGLGVGEAPTPPTSATRAATPSGHVLASRDGAHPQPARARARQPDARPSTARAARGRDGAFGKMAERSAGKDTATGHWEMMGLVTPHAFRVYPQGFPPEIVRAVRGSASGGKVLGNKAASGTEILKELGEEHLRTGSPDPLHVRRQRVPGRGPRGAHPARGALPDLPHRLRDRLPRSTASAA